MHKISFVKKSEYAAGANHPYKHIQKSGERMEKLNNYLVPDYYGDFHCKMGACRNACCEGWPITLSLKDYYKLLGAEVSGELRIKLDCALHLVERPTNEEYAQILPRYDGRCPMRMDDGRCALHYELGEDALSDVCRLYPRGVRSGEIRECSCANSCEAVVEMLMERNDKIMFRSVPLKLKAPVQGERKHYFETAGCEMEIRMHLISVLQDRSRKLTDRIALLGMTLKHLSEALKASDHEWVEKILKNEETIEIPFSVHPAHEDLMRGLEIANQMLRLLDEKSESIREYGTQALDAFGSGEHEFTVYSRRKEKFEKAFPNWEIWFEHMLVNHIFFVQFPFQDRPVNLGDEYLALLSVYMLLRFLLIGNAENDREKAADVASAVFRLVEHTEFDCFAAPMLKRICMNDYENAIRLLSL